ncbi:MAG: hypothetical protein WBQ72_13920 [Terriglobales bacterium]|jgi:hypothetical protein
MTKFKLTAVVVYAAVAFGVIAAQEHARREPMTFALDCAGGDCTLLKGAADERDAGRFCKAEAG